MFVRSMSLNVSALRGNSSSPECSHDLLIGWEQRMDQLYTYFYLLLFVPGLLLNTVALWVLCRHISKKTKAVIFMINLALADLAHVLSLPLRIYYYFTHTWPFGRIVCLLCFYLKYLNMYASIAFLVCISVQRCVFLLNPFCARRWRRRYDLVISAAVWVVVGLGCSPFILMRSTTNTTGRANFSLNPNPYTPGHTQPYIAPLYASLSPSLSPQHSPNPVNPPTTGCFKDLPTRRLPLPLAAAMMTLAELFGFLLPFTTILYCSIRIVHSLSQRQGQDHHNQNHQAPYSPQARHARLSSSAARQTDRQADRQTDKQTDGEKRRALRMVLSCSALFLFCFAPYHISFLLYLMVSQELVSHCPTQLGVRRFHPVSLCMASLSCCLNPLLYYFLTAEFRQHLTRRTSSFTSQSSSQLRSRLMSLESTSSFTTCEGVSQVRGSREPGEQNTSSNRI